MADSDIATTGILGSQDLRDLLAQFQPSDEDRKMARAAAMWSMGAGILGTPGGLGHALGVGAAAALPAYYNTLQQEQGRRLQNVQALSALYPLLLRDQFIKSGQQFMGGGQPPPAVQGQLPPAPAPVVPTAGMAPSTAAQFGPTPPPPANLAASNVQPAPMQVPQGTPPQSVAGFPQIDPRTQNPMALNAALWTGDPGKFGDMLKELGATHTVRAGDGSLITAYNGMPIAHVSPAGIQMYDQRSGRPTQFVAYGPDKATAEAQYGATVAAAKEAASEGIKFAGREVTTNTGPGGAQQTRLAPAAFGGNPYQGVLDRTLPGVFGMPGMPPVAPPIPGTAAASPSAQPGAVLASLNSETTPPTKWNYNAGAGGLRPGAQAPSGSSAGGTLTAPNPIELEAEKAELTRRGEGLAAASGQIDADARAAVLMRGRIASMRQALSQFQSGPTADSRLAVATVLRDFGANDAADGFMRGDPTAAQMFFKNSVQTAFEAARQQMGGVPRAYQEIEYQLKANPGVALLPETNNKILDFLDATAKFQLAKQQARDAWLSPGPNGHTSLTGFESEFNQTHRLAQFLPPVRTGVEKSTGRQVIQDADGVLRYAQ